MPVIMFKPQFAELVRTGAKLQTVRPVRKHPVKVGDALTMRAWVGRPYWSKQRHLRFDTCRKTYGIDIDAHGLLWLNGGTVLLSAESHERFARTDGFKNHAEMTAWFKETHGLPFKGVVISWAEDSK